MTLVIRPATKEDIPAIAAVHLDGWQGAYGGIIDQDHIDSFTLESRINDWTKRLEDTQILVAETEAGIRGFISFGQLRTAPPGTSKIRPAYSSEIYSIYLKENFYRQGIGTQLLIEASIQLKDQKHKSLCLWSLDKNKRANSFYEKMDGKRIGKVMIVVGPTKAKELCYGWRDISVITSR